MWDYTSGFDNINYSCSNAIFVKSHTDMVGTINGLQQQDKHVIKQVIDLGEYKIKVYSAQIPSLWFHSWIHNINTKDYCASWNTK